MASRWEQIVVDAEDPADGLDGLSDTTEAMANAPSSSRKTVFRPGKSAPGYVA